MTLDKSTLHLGIPDKPKPADTDKEPTPTGKQYAPAPVHKNKPEPTDWDKAALAHNTAGKPKPIEGEQTQRAKNTAKRLNPTHTTAPADKPASPNPYLPIAKHTPVRGQQHRRSP